MAGIRSTDAKPLPLLPTPLPVTTNIVQSLLETMDAMSTLHPELQRVVDEQKAMETSVSQLEGQLELLPAPISISPTAGADAFDEPAAQLTPVAAVCGPMPRPLLLPAASTTGAVALCGSETGQALLPSAPTAATASYVASRPSLLSVAASSTATTLASSPTLGFGAATSSLLYKPTLFAWDPG
jgi:hypothetical protein